MSPRFTVSGLFARFSASNKLVKIAGLLIKLFEGSLVACFNYYNGLLVLFYALWRFLGTFGHPCGLFCPIFNYYTGLLVLFKELLASPCFRELI